MDGSGESSGRQGASGHGESGPAPADMAGDLAGLARDWIELWQSELTALAADPETAETWARLASLWAGAAASGLAALPRGAHDPRARPGWFSPWPGSGHEPWPGAWAAPPQPPGAAAAAAASQPGGAAPHGGSERLLERVLDRLEAIERRLASLEQRGGGGARPAAGGRARGGGG